jgi:hypothetical protein
MPLFSTRSAVNREIMFAEKNNLFKLWNRLSYGFRLIDSMVRGIHASLRSR